MFDRSLPEPASLSGVDDAELIGAIEGWARVAAAAEARQLAAVAELARRCCDDEDDERALWACDPWDSAAAEVAAALNVSHGRALGQLDLGVKLRDRLPRVNALFLAGSIPARTVSTIGWRTLLLTDDEALAVLDTELAEAATTWGPLSDYKLVQSIDACVERVDLAAVRRTRTAARSRDVTVGDRDDETGTASIWGRLLATDATLLQRRLAAMAHSVCKDDPRTLGQRRADALGALAAGSDHLACTCGTPDCPAAADDGRATNVVVHIVGDQSALQAEPDPHMHGDGSPPPDPDSPTPTKPRPAQVRRPAAGLITGGGIVPAPLLAELIRAGAKVRFVGQPCDEAEPRYRPSTAGAEFIRIRDLTCRFPGCDRPAEFCDVDHTIPWPDGPTHPSNLKTYCRKHHLLKTFWTGDGGWADRQLPDGTVILTTPSGRTYTTRPASTLLFPGWNTTATAPPPRARPTPTPAAPLGLMMPKRRRTRAQDRNYRIRAERARNEILIGEQNAPY